MLLSRTFMLPLALALAAGALTLAAPQPARAASFTVTKVADTNDGSCDAADCSLREAIIAANTTPGADVITVPSGTYVLTLMGAGEDNAATGDLDITDDVTINGISSRQTVIDGNAADRVFDVMAGVTASITDLWITNGSALNGGGVNNDGALTLTSVFVTNNVAGDSTTSNGGGIANQGTLTVRVDSLIQDNTTTGSGAGIHNSAGSVTVSASEVLTNTAAINGGGINNISGGTLTIMGGSRIDLNTANSAATGGGGIHAGSGTVTIQTSTTIDSNTAVASGGGINIGASATVTITDSTISNNSAQDGGAIDAGGELTITASTLSGNQASDDGGAIFLGSNGVLTALNSTLSGNTAADDGGALLAGAGGSATLTHVTIANNSAAGAGGGIREANGTVEVRNTIVALNGSGGDCSGTVNAAGVNLDGDGSCAVALSNATPGLDTLQDNGGPTFTHALLSGSPALNAADPAFSPSTDQRGVPRPAATPDIGAFERSLIDLTVTIEWAPVDPALLAAALLRFQASNQGPDAAGDVEVTLALPAGVRVESTPPECREEGVAVVCELGDLLAGAMVELTITVTTTVEGMLTVSAAATGIGEEQNAADNTAQATAQVQPATATLVTLAAEWNLVGWHGPSTPVAEAVAGIAAQITALFVFDSAPQGFLSFRTALPGPLNSLKTLEPGQGVWLRVTDPQGAVWEQPTAELLPAVQLQAGPNLVAWFGADGIAVADAVATLGDALERLFLWDATDQRFLSFDPALPESLARLNTALTLRFGAGVWLIIRRDVSWSFAGP